MMSLTKTWDEAGLLAWYAKISRTLGHAPALVVEPKIDGVGIELTYRAGLLVSVATRSGHILEGLESPDLPERLTEPLDLVVRGEAWIPRDACDGYKSPRYAAIAAIQSVPPRPVCVTVWGVESEPIADGGPTTARALERLGLIGGVRGEHPTIHHAIARALDIRDECHRYHHATDGAVIKVASLSDRARLGATRTAPRWAIAFKWEASPRSTGAP